MCGAAIILEKAVESTEGTEVHGNQSFATVHPFIQSVRGVVFGSLLSVAFRAFRGYSTAVFRIIVTWGVGGLGGMPGEAGWIIPRRR